MGYVPHDDGSWSRALLASWGLVMPHEEPPRTEVPELREAAGANLTPDRFLELARHRNPQVREALARRGDCSAGVLAALAHDARAAVRLAVASHPRTPRPALVHLSRDRVPAVLKAVTRNAAVPPDLLERLGDHRREEVRRAAQRALAAPRPPR